MWRARRDHGRCTRRMLSWHTHHAAPLPWRSPTALQPPRRLPRLTRDRYERPGPLRRHPRGARVRADGEPSSRRCPPHPSSSRDRPPRVPAAPRAQHRDDDALAAPTTITRREAASGAAALALALASPLNRPSPPHPASPSRFPRISSDPSRGPTRPSCTPTSRAAPARRAASRLDSASPCTSTSNSEESPSPPPGRAGVTGGVPCRHRRSPREPREDRSSRRSTRVSGHGARDSSAGSSFPRSTPTETRRCRKSRPTRTLTVDIELLSIAASARSRERGERGERGGAPTPRIDATRTARRDDVVYEYEFISSERDSTCRVSAVSSSRDSTCDLRARRAGEGRARVCEKYLHVCVSNVPSPRVAGRSPPRSPSPRRRVEERRVAQALGALVHRRFASRHVVHESRFTPRPAPKMRGGGK